jgi:serine/threonine protein phosphatase PrpC
MHSLCAQIADAIIKYSMEKNSVDNVTVIFVAFKNFENKMKDPNFEYKHNTKCIEVPDQLDFSRLKK